MHVLTRDILSFFVLDAVTDSPWVINFSWNLEQKIWNLKSILHISVNDDLKMPLRASWLEI